MNEIIPSGQTCQVQEIGNNLLFPTIILKDVLYIPSFKINMLSLIKITVLFQEIVSKR